MNAPSLLITASPHLGAGASTPTIMWNVVASLAPVVAAAAYFFGPSAVLVVAAATAGALVTERVFGRRGTLGDGSAAITGILLGLTLPAGLPLWMAFVGGVFGIGIGKLLFGGLGQNVFNPALLGRAFLQASFPVAMTTFPPLAGAGDRHRHHEERARAEEPGGGGDERHQTGHHVPHDLRRAVAGPQVGRRGHQERGSRHAAAGRFRSATFASAKSWGSGMLDGQVYPQQPHSMQSARCWASISS